LALITQVSDPTLWTTIHEEWLDSGCAGFFPCGGKYYQYFMTSSNEDAFKELAVVHDLLDTRSVKSSKKASYRKLEDG